MNGRMSGEVKSMKQQAKPSIFRVVDAPQDVLKAMIVRGIVFIEEQQVGYDGEIDAYEETAVHVLGEIDGEPVAAGRLRFLDDRAKLERIAVRPRWRGRGYGRGMVAFLLDEARRRGYRSFTMHAQAHLVDYYRQQGFEPVGGVFVECGIDHRTMNRDE
jgi:predicted GNAT family N-acyltransferase